MWYGIFGSHTLPTKIFLDMQPVDMRLRAQEDLVYFQRVFNVIPKPLSERVEQLDADPHLPFGKHKSKKQPPTQNRQKQAAEEQATGDTKRPFMQEKGKMIFSKFELANGNGALPKPGKGQNKKKLLEKLLNEQKKLELLSSKDTAKAEALQEQAEWDKAAKRSQGARIYDDPSLLKKAIQIKEKKKKNSQKEWKGRIAKQKKSRPGFEGNKFGGVSKRRNTVPRGK